MVGCRPPSPASVPLLFRWRGRGRVGILGRVGVLWRGRVGVLGRGRIGVIGMGKVGVLGRGRVRMCGRGRVGVGFDCKMFHELFHLVLLFLIHYIYSYSNLTRRIVSSFGESILISSVSFGIFTQS